MRNIGRWSITATFFLILVIAGNAFAAAGEATALLPEPQPYHTCPDTGDAPLMLSVALYVINLSAIDEADEYF